MRAQFWHAEADLSHEDALLVLKVGTPNVGKDGLSNAQSARTIYDREKNSKKIITFSKDLDFILGGGVPVGQITEFCGVPGVGKTQMGMQLAINVALPLEFNGMGGEAIYIDTEGSFMIERCFQMASAFCRHLSAAALYKNDLQRQEAAKNISPEKILQGIHLFRCRNTVEQLAVVDILPSFLAEHPSVKLIVIDSVTFHFRQDYEDLGSRARHLNHMAQNLMSIAGQRQIAVVMMNQVTTKLLGENQSRLVPALGDSWAHAATTRIVLYWKDSIRHAFVYKSPSQPPAAAKYTVTSDGIRSLSERKHGKSNAMEGAESVVGHPGTGVKHLQEAPVDSNVKRTCTR